ncbi:NYN domain-containing protein [Burkholderia ubonensis]|uniref:NYN domain-containing protein n=1 Tax=Burkholderia ubonensis TaxID=101571 RepID=A0ABD4E5F2_9BURK|nr:NYN domain-containing protein [Burkholderia ubonensis]KVN86883.1 NYN domain-containing protein [Burkholderia ubonensis]KVP81591.1 NYN domain-containing protein [Burkholderia ubonensis]KVU26565.1 NYN domain-containing protein [Burkholderia ubonensis]KVU95400.1 NYN domain-containing protein [Burkholderia ubonensis]KVZ52751.1 NYN domain-containing protein [Burkholderia ubonensis]
MPTAILIDGAFFIKRFRAIEPQNAQNARRAAECAHRWACAHLTPPTPRPARRNGGDAPAPDHLRMRQQRRELYRIFFYDCPPLDKKMHNPISKQAIDFSKSAEAAFRLELHEHLRGMRKVALRLGHLSTFTQWIIKSDKVADLLARRIEMKDITPDDVTVDVRQKGVDMRIGVDVSSLAFKKQVDQIVLIAGDADFVPAAKQARREGIDFILDPMWQRIPPNLNEHVDGLRSTCPQQQRRPAPQPAPQPDVLPVQQAAQQS